MLLVGNIDLIRKFTHSRKKGIKNCVNFMLIGTTKIKMSGDKSQEQNSSSTEFIERRRAALERYLNRTAAHPVLSIDPDFREFLEAGK